MKAVVFDFDGTIADSLLGVLAVYKRFRTRGFPHTTDEVNDFRNKSIFRIARELKIPVHHMLWLALFGRRMFQAHLDKVHFYHGMKELLVELREKGIKLYILSTNRAETIYTFLSRHGLSGVVENVYGKAFVLNKSPRLKSLLKAERINREDIVCVGDELLDVLSARRVGVRSVAVSWGYTSRGALLHAHPDALVDNADELRAALKKLGAAV